MYDRNDGSGVGCGCLILFFLIGFCIHFCSETRNSDKKEQGTSSSWVSGTNEETVFSRGESQVDPIVEEYRDNHLTTGESPYENEISVKGSDSRIIVKTSGTDRTDVVVILKKNDRIVRNQYVQAGDQAVFNIPDGTYQIFFYYGKGWYPEKEMPNGMKGGFVMYESFSKDDPQYLENNILTYELILQTNGNFRARPSSADEAF